MKLYYYEHCPFCIRVLMLIHYKNIPVEKIVLLNDDEKTPISMIGQKMLPVLQKGNGEFMPESLDIIDYLDGLGKRILPAPVVSESISNWLQEARHPTRELTYPRMIRHPFEEFSTQSARDYFESKKSKSIGVFSEHMANSEQLLVDLQPKLQVLDNWIAGLNHEHLTWDDIYLFPYLLQLALVDAIIWPENVKRYLLTKSKALQLPTYTVID